MIIRRKPDVLVSITPKLRESTKYQGQDMVPIIIWSVGQVSGLPFFHIMRSLTEYIVTSKLIMSL